MNQVCTEDLLFRYVLECFDLLPGMYLVLEEVEGIFVQDFQCLLDVLWGQSQSFKFPEFYTLSVMQEL